MIRNYLTLAIRNLVKRKLFSFISIFGLAVGMAASLVLWKYVQFELNYDKYNLNADVLYRITNSIYSNGEQWSVGGYDLGPSIKSEIPEVKTFIRVHPLYEDAVVSHHPKTGEPIIFREANLQFVDSSFLRAFTFQPVYGNLSDALINPSSVVLTKSICEKYFGQGIDPTGKTLQISYGYLEGGIRQPRWPPRPAQPETEGGAHLQTQLAALGETAEAVGVAPTPETQRSLRHLVSLAEQSLGRNTV